MQADRRYCRISVPATARAIAIDDSDGYHAGGRQTLVSGSASVLICAVLKEVKKHEHHTLLRTS